jgi:hypothetical protein
MNLFFDASKITVSGVGVPLNGVAFPSGQIATNQPGSNLCAFLSSTNATFGFNIQPHAFQTEWIPCGPACDFHGASGQLPPIGQNLEFFVGDFLVRGHVTHADYTSNINGTTVNITIEDNRKTLKRLKIHSEDLGENVPSGIVSIARAYRRANGLTDVNGDPSDVLIKEYERILQFGGTYSQILAGIDLAFSEGRTTVSVNDLPTSEQLERNIGGTIESIRWQFNLSELDEVLTRVLQDTGFDWYWSMDALRPYLVNKKTSFAVDENEILDLVSNLGSVSGFVEGETKQIGFGQDLVPDPTRFRVLGGHQEGFINSPLLSPIDGLETSSLDGNITFVPAWPNISVGFFDAGGFYRTYIPSEKELQLALAGIEQWSYFKLYQTTALTADPPGFGLLPDAGSIAAQDPTFESRLDPTAALAAIGTGAAESGIRIIGNRRDQEHNWTLTFYNRVRSHASAHYARSYTLEGLVFNEGSGLFRVISSAWANVENQVQDHALSASGVPGSGLFIQDYEINRSLGPISPFVSDDFRVSAHCILPADTRYGAQGDSVPASFGGWTEDAPPFNPTGDGSHYIPVSLTIVGQQVIDPRSDNLYGFEVYPEGTLLCQLPINAGPASGIVEESIISSLATLVTTNTKLQSSGLVDLINPANVLNAYPVLSGVAIPVEGRSRYGQVYPSEWVLGENHFQREEDVQLDDQFVPWAFSPVGDQTSIEVMSDRAIRRVEGKIVPRSDSTFADFSQVGLPVLSFDSFAGQGVGPSGLYGEISHGISEMNMTFGIDGFTTRYKMQSYFSQFGKDAPLGDKVRGLINGIINPIDFVDLQLLNNLPLDAGLPFSPAPIDSPIFFDAEKRAVRVTISSVNNVFTLTSTPPAEQERYRGIDTHKYEKPPSVIGFGSNKDFTEGAICVDGFLNIGDEALYHTDEFELSGGNSIFRYFTGGREYASSTIVEVKAEASSTTYDVIIVDPGFTSGGERALLSLEVLNGSVEIGDKTTIASQGNAAVKPGVGDGGIFLNGTAQETTQTAGVMPVEIVEVQGQGTDLAFATCKVLGIDSNGRYSIASGTVYGDVIPIPFRQFAASGDRGFLTTPTSVPSGGFGVTGPVNFVEIVRPAFGKFSTF